jgi:regulator-associated protein of mTOR
MRTVSVALVACLNIGVDPPDVVKPQPCARLECWADPLAMPPQKALDTIGNTLQLQYERWQPRVRCDVCHAGTGICVENEEIVCLGDMPFW